MSKAVSVAQLPVKAKPYIIVVGTPFNGMIPYGPFDTKEAAIAWGDRSYPIDEWHIVPLEKAEDPYESLIG